MDNVTLSLEKYEEMKSEIARLQKEVQQKEIIRYRDHPAKSLGVLIAGFGFFIWILTEIF